MRKNKIQKKLILVGKIIGGVIFLGVFVFILSFLYFAKDLPRPERFAERAFVESTKILDRTGQVVLFELFGEERRTYVPLKRISPHMVSAVLAAEDANFYSHYGFDLQGIVRSILHNIKIRRAQAGGSTINQQLIRSTFLSSDRTVERKFKELILSLELDRRYEKDQILEWYLNQVPFGRNAYGIESAAQSFFEKPAQELSITEAATLASLIQAPSLLSSEHNQERLLARRNAVLDAMAEHGFITQEEADLSKEEELDFIIKFTGLKAPHFTLHVRDYLEETYGQDMLLERGLRVYTTLDWDLQEEAERIVRERGEINAAQFNAHNAALVAIDPHTGDVLSLVGSRDWFADPYPVGCTSGADCLFDPKFNAATGSGTQPGRQPGSAFKPFAYVTAFEQGYTDDHVVTDEETDFGIWGGEPYIPQNYDGRFRGDVTLRESLARSLNIPSVKVLLDLAGLQESVRTAERFGITTLRPPYGPSIVLGGWEVRPLEVTSAYGVFATEGLRVSPSMILRVEDSEGNILEERRVTPQRVIDKLPTQIINSILSDNEARTPAFGPNSRLYFPNYQVAAKTGTTQEFRDGWTIGYTPSIVVGVWAGNNNNARMAREPGVSIAAPIWRQFMEVALPKFPKRDFTPPPVLPIEEEESEE